MNSKETNLLNSSESIDINYEKMNNNFEALFTLEKKLNSYLKRRDNENSQELDRLLLEDRPRLPDSLLMNTLSPIVEGRLEGNLTNNKAIIRRQSPKETKKKDKGRDRKQLSTSSRKSSGVKNVTTPSTQTQNQSSISKSSNGIQPKNFEPSNFDYLLANKDLYEGDEFLLNLKTKDELEDEMSLMKEKLAEVEFDNKTKNEELKTSRTKIENLMMQLKEMSSLVSSSNKPKEENTVAVKIEKLEGFYQNKTAILEERILQLQAENTELEGSRSQAKRDIERMQADFSKERDNTRRLAEENLKGAEKVIKLEYERRIAELERKHREEVKEKNRNVGEAQAEIQRLQDEILTLKEELKGFETKYLIAEEERNHISLQYANLLYAHNQILQFDIQKNERTLMNERNSFLLTESDISVLPKPHQFSSSKKQTIKDPGSYAHKETPGKSREIFEVLNTYKNELDKLKTNNSRIAEQFREEIRRLNEELDTQNKEKEVMLKELERVHKKERNMENKTEIVNYIRKLEQNCRDLELSNRNQLSQNKALEERLWTLGHCCSDHSEGEPKARNPVKMKKVKTIINYIDDKENIPPPSINKVIKKKKEAKQRVNQTCMNESAMLDIERCKVNKPAGKVKSTRQRTRDDSEKRSLSVGKGNKANIRYSSVLKQQQQQH